MVNTAKLNAYIEKAGTTWEKLAKDGGGLPDTLQNFADYFPLNASADDVVWLADRLEIPSYQIGLVFFAPEEYGNETYPHLVELRDGDAMAEIYAGLSLKSRAKRLSLAFELQDAKAEEVANYG